MQKILSDNTTEAVPANPNASSVPDLSVVIVNYNVKEFVEQAIVSVQKALRKLRGEIIVVDNASSDGSQALIRQRFPEVRLLENSENVGFARASNQGLKASHGRFLLLLNPDTIVQEDTFDKILSFFEQHSDAGLVGCKILNPDGTLQLACRRSFPTPWVAFSKLSGLSHLFAGSRLFGRYNLTYLDPDETYEVEAISGSFMMLRRETLEKVGLLDESFFMYGEDLDLCYRIHKSEWKVIYFPETQIIHFKGESSKKAQFDSLRVFYQAMGLFARKHLRKRYLFMPYWILWGAIWLRGGLAFLASLTAKLATPLVDLIILISAIICGIYWRFSDFSNVTDFVPVLIAYSLVWMTMLSISGCYGQHRFSSSRAALAILGGFLINTSLTFFFKQYAFSRLVVLFGTALSFVAVPGWRLAFKLLARSGFLPFQGTLGKTLLARKTLVVGDLESAQKLVQKLHSQVDSGYDIYGLISTNGRHTGEILNGVEVLGSVEQLNLIIAKGNVQEVIFSTQELSYDRILAIIARSGNQRVNFKLIPSNLDVIIGKSSIDRIDDVPFVEIDYKLHRKSYLALKRAFDVTLAFITLIPAFPFYLAGKFLSGGGVQERTIWGNTGKVTLVELKKSRRALWHKMPYLLAVLRGEISLVGAEMVEVGQGPSSSGNKLGLKPGLTGLVQVNKQKDLSPEDKEKYEIYYLKNYSPLLDLEIIFKALFKL